MISERPFYKIDRNTIEYKILLDCETRTELFTRAIQNAFSHQQAICSVIADRSGRRISISYISNRSDDPDVSVETVEINEATKNPRFPPSSCFNVQTWKEAFNLLPQSPREVLHSLGRNLDLAPEVLVLIYTIYRDDKNVDFIITPDEEYGPKSEELLLELKHRTSLFCTDIGQRLFNFYMQQAQGLSSKQVEPSSETE